MGVERTDRWLEHDLIDPIKICERITAISMKKEDPEKLYDYLIEFGMYIPNQSAKKIFEELKEEDIWITVEEQFRKYQRKWNGPEIPIYIFPINGKRRFNKDRKSGISFQNQMILFLDSSVNKKEIEALIVHEYHHICRMNKSKKPINEFTLLDSMIIEGFAEYAVKNCCGPQYNGKWISEYKKESLEYYWEKVVKRYIQSRRDERIHDQLLYGKGPFPSLLGYAIGYWLIEKTYRSKTFSIQETFTIDAEELLE